LRIEGLLPTRYDARTLHAREILEQTRHGLPGDIRVFDTIVRESVRFKESPITGRSILSYAGSSEGARAYRDLASEIDRA
jgi:chromosome partitioning protein